MKQLNSLYEERAVVKQRLVDVDKEIATHPETIRNAFYSTFSEWNLESFDKLVEKVTFVRNLTLPYGVAVQFDGTNYRLRTDRDGYFYGILDSDEKQLDVDLLDNLWDKENEVGFDPVAYLADKQVDETMMIGYFLARRLI